MDHFIVDRAADGGGKAAVTQKGGFGPSLLDHSAGCFVQLAGGNTRRDQIAGGEECRFADLSRLLHDFQFVFGFDGDHKDIPNASNTNCVVSASFFCPRTASKRPS